METEKAQDSSNAQTNNTGPNAPNGLIAEAQAVIDSSKPSAQLKLIAVKQGAV